MAVRTRPGLARLHATVPGTATTKASRRGKTTGEIEHVYAGSERLKKELIKRRFQLKRNPDAYVFGTEDGRRVRGFRRMWRELFRLAGLDFGRDKGLTWHTIRHEFVSRTIENTGDPVGDPEAGPAQGRPDDAALHARTSLAPAGRGRATQSTVVRPLCAAARMCL